MSPGRIYTKLHVAITVAVLFLSFANPLQAYVGPGAGFAFLSSFLVLIGVFFLAILSLLSWPFRMVYWMIKARKTYGRSKVKKLVIVGLDGMDPTLTEKFMSEGKLPNFSRIKKQGDYANLRTTIPSVSPVAWSSFMTGTNPAKHNIFDFLSRDRRSHLPTLSSAYIGKPERVLSLGKFRIPLSKPEIRGMRKSVPFWKILGDHGIFSTILRVPVTFPAEKFKGHILSGMCAPDLKGSQGTFSYYSSKPEKPATIEGGILIPVEVVEGTIRTYISGPENTIHKDAPELRLPLKITLLPDEESAQIQLDGQELTIGKGELSPWIRLTFKLGLGMKVRGICRLLISSVRPDFEMYVTPLNIDPEKPALPISYPFYYSIYLSKLLGKFITLGLANDTWALNEGALTEKAFLEFAYSNHQEWEEIFLNALDKTKRGVVACVFETTDSIQHMFFRYLSKGHPALIADQSHMSTKVIEDLYQKMDEFVGRLQDRLDEKSVLLVMSDHGFKAFRRGVNLNTWLFQNGYLALRNGRSESQEWFKGVDWKKTKAYALGLAGIYINQMGRESDGLVAPGDETKALKHELIEKLTGLVDEERGCRSINEVYNNDIIFSGPYRENAPDLIVGYSEGYRASWDSVKGKVSRAIFQDNIKAWSGDHCIDPKLVPGVIFCNRKLKKPDPSIWDIAPSTLELFGIPIPAHMDGHAIIVIEKPGSNGEERKP